MTMIVMLRDVQIPLLSAMLLGGCVSKLARVIRVGSMDAGLGPTALFPMRLRRPVAMAMCALECGLGLGLIATAGEIGRGAPATCVRLGAGLLFLVATSALLELRASRPDIGCGCFGDFSHAPVGWRTLIRSALLSLAALITIGLSPVRPPHSKASAALLLGVLAAELVVIACLSPELGEALVKLGYSEPCELRVVPAERTLTALRRSKQWRRHAGLLTADVPVDVWRELCWRYLVFPGRYGDREAEVVFAVFLRQRRPLIHAALVDAATGNAVQWPTAPNRAPWLTGPLTWRGQPAAPAAQPGADATLQARAWPPGQAFSESPGQAAGHSARAAPPRSAAFY
jgi:hypothetical protein